MYYYKLKQFANNSQTIVQNNTAKSIVIIEKSLKDILKPAQCIHTIEACFFIGVISSCYNIAFLRDNFYVWDITFHDVGQSTRKEEIMEQY